MQRVRPSALAALLSFVWPGLGQAYRGARRRALAFAIPPLVAIGAVGVFAMAMGPAVFVAHLLNPLYAAATGLLVVAFAAWWAAAIIDAGRPHSAKSMVASLALVALVALASGWAGTLIWSLYQAGIRISEPPTVEATPPPTPTVTNAPGSSPSASPSPTATPIDRSDRVTILFIGRDASGGAEGRLTDTIQVASFDPRTNNVVMISLPRDTGQLELYKGGTWRGKVNELMAYAESHPAEFPEGAIEALRQQVAYIIGIPIDYYAVVNFRGFEHLVDMIGGVDVVVDRPIRDSTYWHSPDRRGFYMEPGEHHLDGATALAYVRSRHGPGNSDFERARRQQQVLLALRDKIDDPNVIANMPSLIDAASQMVRTDMPLDRVPETVGLLQNSTTADVETYVLQPRRFAEVIPQSEVGRYMTRLKMDAVAELSIDLFGDDSRYAQEEPDGE